MRQTSTIVAMLPGLSFDLPLLFNEYYTYLASVGTVVGGVALFIDPTFVSSRVAFEMGAIGVLSGLLGWLVDSLWKTILQTQTWNGDML